MRRRGLARWRHGRHRRWRRRGLARWKHGGLARWRHGGPDRWGHGDLRRLRHSVWSRRIKDRRRWWGNRIYSLRLCRFDCRAGEGHPSGHEKDCQRHPRKSRRPHRGFLQAQFSAVAIATSARRCPSQCTAPSGRRSTRAGSGRDLSMRCVRSTPGGCRASRVSVRPVRARPSPTSVP